jgi:flagellar hook-length control protein FliK
LDAQRNVLALVGLETEASALEGAGAQGMAETLPENILDRLPAQLQPDSHARPPSTAAAQGVRSELPNTAQVALAHAVREALTAANASPPLTQAQQHDTQMRTMPVLAGSTGLEAITPRLLMADSAAAPLHMTTAGAQTVLPQDALASTRSALPTATLDTPLRQPGWDKALSERVMWVVNQKFQGVELKLNPAHLGPIEVRVQMQNDQAQVSFVAQHGPVREALEAALPRLREMFNANGFNLADVNISQHSFAEQQRQAQGSERRGQGSFASDNEADLGDIPHPDRRPVGAGALGGVDLFA